LSYHIFKQGYGNSDDLG